MFKKRGVRVIVPVFVVLVVGVGAAIHLAGGPEAKAQTTYPSLTPDQLVSAMQARADGLSGLTGVLGTRPVIPSEGDWSGVPFAFQGPARYVREDGQMVSSPGAAPVTQANAWQMFVDGEVYLREGSTTFVARSGYWWRDRVAGCGPDALLMVNLAPRAWFDAFKWQVHGGTIEEVGGRSYYTLTYVSPGLGPDDMIRFRELHPKGTPRKYYIDPESFVCERIVYGVHGAFAPFADPAGDVVATEVVPVGKVLLPVKATMRTFQDGAVVAAAEVSLHDLSVVSAGQLADGAFEPLTRSPGPKPIILRPAADIDELKEAAARGEADPGEWLMLAWKWYQVSEHKLAAETLERASDQFAGQVPEDFEIVKARIWEEVEPALVNMRLQVAPQARDMFKARAARFRERGDPVHADDMASQAGRWQAVYDAASARATELGITVE